MKERTVGAIVLVVFIVLVVPVFLDGPEPEPAVVSEAVTLPGQNGQPRKRQTIVLERDRSEPVPTPTAGGTTGGSGAATAAREAQPTPAEPPATTAAQPPAAAGDAGTSSSGDSPAARGSDTTTAGSATPPPTEAPAPTAAATSATASPAGSATRAVTDAAGASATGMWAVQLGSFSNKDNAERLASELRGKGYAAFLSQLRGPDGPLHRVRIGPQKDRDSAEAMAARLSRDGHRGQVVPHP